LAAEAVELQLHIRKIGRPPWERHAPRGGKVIKGVRYPPLRYYVLSIVLRGFAAAVVVGAFAAGGQISGAVGALALGIGASMWITRAAELKDIGVLPGTAEERDPGAGGSSQ
jgi:hypothetical protein